MRKRTQDSIGLFLIGLLLIGCFAPVVMGRASLLTSPIAPGVLPEGPYGYNGHRVRSGYVIDPGASAWVAEPWIKLAGNLIREGHVPLWNPYNGFGAPLAANMQSGVFFPPHWLLFFSSDPWTWNLFLLLRLYVAGAFTYLYLRSLRIYVLPAFVSGTAFMLSGHFVLYVNMMHLNVEMLLPLVLYLTEGLIRYRTIASMMLLGGGLTLTVLGGMPESTLFLWSFTTLYYAVRIAVLGARRRAMLATVLRLFPLIAVALVVACGLSAVLLLPFIEFLSHAWTAHSGTIGLIGNRPSTAISLLVPYFFRELRQPWTWVGGHDALPYIGVMPILLAFLALPTRGRLRGIALLCSGYAIIGVLKAYTFPGVNWIGSIPPFDRSIFAKYNHPEVVFSVAILAGIGAHNMLQAPAKMSIRRIALIWAILAFAIVTFLGIWWPGIVGADAVWWVTKKTAFALLILIVGATLLYGMRMAQPIRRTLALAAIAIVLVVELYSYIPKDRPSKYEAEATPPFMEFLRTRCPPAECRVYGLDSILFPNWSAVFRLTDIRLLEAMYIDRFLRFSNVFLGNKDPDRFTGGVSRKFRPHRFLGFANVGYLLTAENIADTDLIDEVLHNGERRAKDSSIYKGRLVIDGETKTVLFEQPPSEIIYPLEVPTNGATLRFSLGMDPTVWHPSKGDGMEFEIEVASGGEQVSLFRRHYDPKNQEIDRRWIDGEVDLSPFRGRHIQLRLITRPGDDNAFDQGGWGDLRLVSADSLWPMLVYDGEVKIYENRAVAPRAFVVHRAEVIQGEKALIERLQSPGFDPRRMVLLEDNEPTDRLQGLGAEVPDGAVARITKYHPDRVEMTVETAHPGVLVLLDSYYPGWRATVNGKPAHIYRANYLFRGVLVEAGEHKVRFDYSPWSFRAGLWASGGTLLVIGTAIALSRARQRRRQPIT